MIPFFHGMEQFRAPFGEVEITEEWERHIIQFHPDVKLYRKFFNDTIEHPEIIRHSVFDRKVLICYRLLPPAKKYLAIVIKTNQRNFILTAYLTHRIKHT